MSSAFGLGWALGEGLSYVVGRRGWVAQAGEAPVLVPLSPPRPPHAASGPVHMAVCGGRRREVVEEAAT